MPETNSAPTLAKPSSENRCTATAVTGVQFGSFWRHAAASSIASGGKLPSQAPAAKRCTASAAKGN